MNGPAARQAGGVTGHLTGGVVVWVTEPCPSPARWRRHLPFWIAAAAPAATVGPLSLASGPSPFAACTTGLDPGSPPGTNFVNAEVEPFVAVNPANSAN